VEFVLVGSTSVLTNNSRCADYQTFEVSMNLLAKIVYIFNLKTT